LVLNIPFAKKLAGEFARIFVANNFAHTIAFAERYEFIDHGLRREWRLYFADRVDKDALALAVRNRHGETVSAAARWIDEC
jgi:hypothetical protein